jgi:hypothetical protein
MTDPFSLSLLENVKDVGQSDFERLRLPKDAKFSSDRVFAFPARPFFLAFSSL